MRIRFITDDRSPYQEPFDPTWEIDDDTPLPKPGDAVEIEGSPQLRVDRRIFQLKRGRGKQGELSVVYLVCSPAGEGKR